MNAPPTTIELTTPRLQRRGSQRDLPTGLLERFYFGSENALAAFVCHQSEPINERGNPLLFVGPSGCGKTTLALTVAAAEQQRRQESNGDQPAGVRFVTGSDFARTYGLAIQNEDLSHFRTRIEQAAIWVVDDVHSLTDKTAAQHELAARIEARVSNHQTTILTCRRLPSELRGVRPLLASRMLPGLTVPISYPSAATRLAILAALCRRFKLEIEDDWIDLLGHGLPENLPVPRLSAVVQQLRLRLADGARLHADLIAKTIHETGSQKDVTIAMIAKIVAKRFHLKTADLKSSTRRQQVVRARSLAMYLGRQLTEFSLQQIGTYFGGRDHTTVLHACRTTERLLVENNQLRQAADEVKQQLRALP